MRREVWDLAARIENLLPFSVWQSVDQYVAFNEEGGFQWKKIMNWEGRRVLFYFLPRWPANLSDFLCSSAQNARFVPVADGLASATHGPPLVLADSPNVGHFQTSLFSYTRQIINWQGPAGQDHTLVYQFDLPSGAFATVVVQVLGVGGPSSLSEDDLGAWLESEEGRDFQRFETLVMALAENLHHTRS